MPPTTNKLTRLSGILSKMKVKSAKTSVFIANLRQYGNSDMFKYATTDPIHHEKLRSNDLGTWGKLYRHELRNASIGLPSNGFHEMMLLTEQGKLWHYPIDNEQGMDAEKEIPFEDHVFLDHLLDDFPENEYIRSFMSNVVAALARNPWMTVDRKHQIIKSYKEYFEEKKNVYEERGLEL